MKTIASHPNERSVAAATHLAAIPFPYIGPLVALIVAGPKSPFVRRHAIRSLVETVFLTIALFIGAATMFCIFTLPTLLEALRTAGQSLTWGDLFQALLRAVAVWIVIAIIGLVATLNNVRQALRAYRGQLP